MTVGHPEATSRRPAAWEYVGRSVGLGVGLSGYRLVDWAGSWSTAATVGLVAIWIPVLSIRAEIPVTVDAAVRPAAVGLWLRERQGAEG